MRAKTWRRLGSERAAWLCRRAGNYEGERSSMAACSEPSARCRVYHSMPAPFNLMMNLIYDMYLPFYILDAPVLSNAPCSTSVFDFPSQASDREWKYAVTQLLIHLRVGGRRTLTSAKSRRSVMGYRCLPPYPLSSQTTTCPTAVLPLPAPLPMLPSHALVLSRGNLPLRFCALYAILGPLFRFVGSFLVLLAIRLWAAQREQVSTLYHLPSIPISPCFLHHHVYINHICTPYVPARSTVLTPLSPLPLICITTYPPAYTSLMLPLTHPHLLFGLFTYLPPPSVLISVVICTHNYEQ